jgi:fructose 1,6-bisphosphatase
LAPENHHCLRCTPIPITPAGLINAPSLQGGCRFEVYSAKVNGCIFYDSPEEMYDLLVITGPAGRYAVKAVRTSKNVIVAVSFFLLLAFFTDQGCMIRMNYLLTIYQ